MNGNGLIKALKLATPKRGTISTMRSADCRICGGRIRQPAHPPPRHPNVDAVSRRGGYGTIGAVRVGMGVVVSGGSGLRSSQKCQPTHRN